MGTITPLSNKSPSCQSVWFCVPFWPSHQEATSRFPPWRLWEDSPRQAGPLLDACQTPPLQGSPPPPPGTATGSAVTVPSLNPCLSSHNPSISHTIDWFVPDASHAPCDTIEVTLLLGTTWKLTSKQRNASLCP